jgi:hypothetical protein
MKFDQIQKLFKWKKCSNFENNQIKKCSEFSRKKTKIKNKNKKQEENQLNQNPEKKSKIKKPAKPEKILYEKKKKKSPIAALMGRPSNAPHAGGVPPR